MSTINIELYDALIAAGASEEKARAAACAINDINQLATKTDIQIMISELGTKRIKWMIEAILIQTLLIVVLIKLI